VSITARTILTATFKDLGVLGQGETMTAPMAQDGLYYLNSLVDQLATQPAAMPFIARQVFDVVANQSTYTMGPGGDFDTTRPTGLTGAGLLLLQSGAPPVEIPRGLLTDDAYQAIQLKTLTSQLWTDVYFNPTYAGGLASVFLWPTPTTSANQCVLYRLDVIGGFADLDTAYDFPYGYQQVYEYGTGQLLATPYGVPTDILGRIDGLAAKALRLVKRTNNRINDLPVDPAFTTNPAGGYNIVTGQGGGGV
jgi:hypothetical protein